MLPSFGTISSIAAQIVILICTGVLYVFFISVVFPSLFLKPKYITSLEGDRGLKKYSFEGGRAIVYEPSVDVKRYIKQYILTALGNEKYIQCKFDSRIKSSEYEVCAFDCDGRLLDTVQIEEPIQGFQQGVSKPVLLPSASAYVRVSVKSVDGIKIEREPMVKIPSSGFKFFTFFTVIWTVAETFIIKVILMDIAKQIFSASFLTKDYGNLFTFILAVAVGLLLSVLGRILHGLNERDKQDLKMQAKRNIRR